MKTANLSSCKRIAFAFILLISFTSLQSFSQTNRSVGFDGYSSHVDLGAMNIPGNFSNGLTVECWVKWNAFQNWSRVLDLGNGEASDNILLANEGMGSNLRYEVYHDGFTTGITSPVSMNNGQWYHVAVSHSNSGIATMYIDGVEVVSDYIDMPYDVARSICYIGKSNWLFDDMFNGQIDEFRLWNVARSKDEIRQNMLKAVPGNSAGLVSYFRFDEGGGTTLTNSSTNLLAGNASLVDPGTWNLSPAKFSANALNVDGVDDHMTVGAPLPFNSSYTKEAWVYVTKNTSLPNNIVSSNRSPFWIDGGNLKAGNTGPSAEVIDPGAFPANTWVHVAVTFDASTGELRLYRGGVLVNSNYSADIFYGEDNYAGAWFNGSATESFLGGMIDEVRIWDVARTQAEIQSTMNTELVASLESRLVAYYTFNQGIASDDNSGMLTIKDQKNDNNGTLMNMTMTGASSNFVAQTNGLIILPVKLRSFTALKQGGSVNLQWSTSTEINALHFVVEHSTDGVVWKNLSVIGAAGNSNSIQHYGHLHHTPSAGKNLYRLHQKDQDGRSSYSMVCTVIFETGSRIFAVKTNVVSGTSVQLQVSQPAYLTLFTQDGKMIWSKTFTAGMHDVELNQGRGIYYLKSNNQTEKIVKM